LEIKEIYEMKIWKLWIEISELNVLPVLLTDYFVKIKRQNFQISERDKVLANLYAQNVRLKFFRFILNDEFLAHKNFYHLFSALFKEFESIKNDFEKRKKILTEFEEKKKYTKF